MEALKVADDKEARLKNVPAGEVAVYNSEQVQIRDTIDEHLSFDILNPSLIRIKHGGGQKVLLESGENKHSFFRP
jgi:phage gp45-like